MPCFPVRDTPNSTTVPCIIAQGEETPAEPFCNPIHSKSWSSTLLPDCLPTPRRACFDSITAAAATVDDDQFAINTRSLESISPRLRTNKRNRQPASQASIAPANREVPRRNESKGTQRKEEKKEEYIENGGIWKPRLN